MDQKQIRSLTFLVVLLAAAAGSSFAQGGVSYEDLVHRGPQQNIYIDFFTLPGSDGNTVQFISTFKIDYSSLPFKKYKSSSSQKKNFYSLASMNMEVFMADKKRDSDEKIPIQGLKSVSRNAWKDTAFAETYEQTQSNNEFIGGYMKVDLQPGLYNYMLQLKRGEDSEEQSSRTRQKNITSFGDKRLGKAIYVREVTQNDPLPVLKLMNFGQNVYYGKDFHAFVHIPSYDESARYSLTVSRIDITKEDTTFKKKVFSTELSSGDIHNNIMPVINSSGKDVSLRLEKQSEPYTYALVNIPNSTFPNAIYRLEVNKEGQSAPVSIGVFKSLWIDMPTSLLNLDVATDMLRFIISREKVKELSNGSKEERERKFRAFWDSRDPTPKTGYNELMAEYYRRIDYAYKHFSTPNIAGYESDRGNIYIKYGPPENVERKFPTGERTVEIWTYDDRKFVFQATSGFGDFKLISR